MKRKLRDLLLIVWFSSGITVMMDPKTEPELDISDSKEEPSNFQNVFASCLTKKIHGVFECANRGTLSVLRAMNREDVLDYDSVKLERAEGQSRELLDLDYDPKDFGNVVQAAARLMERRNLRWDLSNIYPGLQMRVGPMLNGNGVLEFVVDERFRGYTDRQLGTGRMIVRSLVLPFLLGFKFSLASLVPLIFGIILLVTKKALLLTKFALLLSSLLGWNSILTGGHASQGGYPVSQMNPLVQGLAGFGFQNPPGPDTFSEEIGSFHNYDHRYPYRPVYRTLQRSPDFPTYGQHVVREVVNVYDGKKHPENQEPTGNGKNFVWST
ncbi:uncharacterized protein Osi10a [Venturia canescens]|uniref:uncharacterized protein Osi10a n=1 Tax=Venturia canescens TaxID=32260 RepID=UPI001C9C61CE|nr:uncharacterized protein LOC122406605 [Venturia canescens]